MSSTHSPTDAPKPKQPTVLITGAAKRLGREIALNLAQAGWRIAVHYRNDQVTGREGWFALSRQGAKVLR